MPKKADKTQEAHAMKLAVMAFSENDLVVLNFALYLFIEKMIEFFPEMRKVMAAWPENKVKETLAHFKENSDITFDTLDHIAAQYIVSGEFFDGETQGKVTIQVKIHD